MKKIYIAPQIEDVDVNITHSMLAASAPMASFDGAEGVSIDLGESTDVGNITSAD